MFCRQLLNEIQDLNMKTKYDQADSEDSREVDQSLEAQRGKGVLTDRCVLFRV